MRACQYVGLFVGLSLVPGCDARPLWQRFNEPNGGNCMSGQPCAEGQSCNSATEVCEATFDLVSVTPNLASSAGGTRVEIAGRNLRPDLIVRFGSGADSAGSEVTLIDDTRLAVTVPPNVNLSWSVPITLEVPGQSVSKPGLFSYFAATPSFSQQLINAVPRVESVAIADFNHDTRPDALFIVNRSPDASIATLFGNASGGLSAGPTLLFTNRQNQTMLLHDVNRDGFVDLLVGSTVGLEVLLNNKQGGFATAQTFTTDTSMAMPTPTSLAVADWNQDGAVDVAAVNIATGSVSVLRGNGDGTFGAPMILETGTTPAAVVSGDFDGNQRPDLLTLSTTTPVQVRLGDGLGNLPVSSTPSVSGCDPAHAWTMDMNADGPRDLVVQCLDNSVRVLLANGNGTFAAGDVMAASLPAGNLRLTLGDFDGDRRTDVVAALAPALDPTFYLLRGTGGASFRAPENMFTASATLFGLEQADASLN
jgi:hypothetical protein